MDGGQRQAEMADQIKRQVKARAPFRLRDAAAPASVHLEARTGPTASEEAMSDISPVHDAVSNNSDPSVMRHNIDENGRRSPSSLDAYLRTPLGRGCLQVNKFFGIEPMTDRSDVVLTHFLDYVFPYLFPCYRPPPLEGGRSWMFEFSLSSVVMRQAAISQSSYFLALAQEADNQKSTWDALLTQTNEGFGGLRMALHIMDHSDISEHAHGAVRILACILHWQHFEIAVLSFDNWQTHLSACISLFEGLMKTANVLEPTCPSSSYTGVLSSLGPPKIVPSVKDLEVPSAEQAAFRFSTTLLLFDDIIASTVLRQAPRLYHYHRSLLGRSGIPPVLELDTIIGCQNWVMISIGEISALDAWKKDHQLTGSLDVMELVQRATTIKSFLKSNLTHYETSEIQSPNKETVRLGLPELDSFGSSTLLADQKVFISKVWAHAALLYLHIVVSGWQPANTGIQEHVGEVIELLHHRFPQNTVVRTMMWPFCVAGCLAEPALRDRFRVLVDALRPSSLFRTACTALEIMEDIWREGQSGDAANHDLATLFTRQDIRILLV